MIRHLWRGKANAAWVLETAVGKLKEREKPFWELIVHKGTQFAI